MLTPTLSVDAVQLSVTLPRPPVAVRLVGAVGACVSAGGESLPEIVRIAAFDGKPCAVEGRDLLSRCLPHEIDHLHGRLFIDYLSALKRRSAMNKWAKEKDKYPGNIRRLTPAEVAAHHPRERVSRAVASAHEEVWLSDVLARPWRHC